jgi:hypothetical protein
MVVVIVSLIIDSSLMKIVPFYNTYSDIGTRELVFVLLFAILCIAQVLILNYLIRYSTSAYAKKEPRIIRRALYACQYSQLVILSFLASQVIFMSQVFTNFLTILGTISYTLSSVIFGILSYYFWQWYITNKNPVVFSYAVCCSILTFNLLISILFIDILLQQRQEVLFPQLGLSDRFISSDATMNILHYLYVLSSIAGFMAAWIASVVLLYHYSARRGRAKSWILLSLPLVFFLSQFIGLLFNLFPAIVGHNPVFYGNLLTIIYAVSRPAGGILFGLAFWIISTYIKQNDTVRDYLIRSAYGFMLLFVSNQAIVLITTNYPPFGVITITFLPIASYLVFSGIYSVAVSVSQDLTLRKSIKKSVEKELHFVDSIGVAQMNKNIQHKVLNMTKKLSSQIHDETGIANSLSDEDIKLYIREALSAKLKSSKTK